MSIPSFQQTQLRFAGHLRDPAGVAAPMDVEDRRMAIYRDLVYNNLENFLANGFPVLKAVVEDHHWHELVRDFLRDYRCNSPYFLEIGQEFLRYLKEVRQPKGWEPPFMLELCHYEWVELALDTTTDELPDNLTETEPALDQEYRVSPLVWRLFYSYPVHRISSQFKPEAPVGGGVHLLVYRGVDDRVGFMEINPAVSRMIQLIESKDVELEVVLRELAAELHYPDFEDLVSFAMPIIAQLIERAILLPAGAGKI